MEPSENEQLQLLLKAHQDDPEGYQSNLDLGLFLYASRKTRLESARFLAKAISHGRLDRHTPLILEFLADLQFLMGNPQAGLETYQLAQKICPDMIDFVLRTGDALFRLGHVEEASETFKRAGLHLDGLADQNPRDENGKRVRFLGPNKVILRFFGELALRLDFFLKVRAMNPVPDERPILLAPTEDVVNPALLDYFDDKIEIVRDQAEIDTLLATYPNAWIDISYLPIPDGRVLNRNIALQAVQKKWEDEGHGPLLQLKPEHEAKGRDLLKQAGLPDDAWFAAIHVREPGYYDEDYPWSRNLHRSSDIETYTLAIKAIIDRGGWVVRLGDPSMKPLAKMDHVIDYAKTEELRHDWMDVYLIAAARFILGAPSGPQGPALAFGTPFIGANYFPPGTNPLTCKDLFIHKLVKSEKTGETLSIAEAIRPPNFMTLEPYIYQSLGLTIHDNTPEEIRDVTIEMMDRLDGTSETSVDARSRQATYLRLADPYRVGIASNVSDSFLRNHPELITENN